MRLFLLLLVAVAVLAVLPLSGAFRTFAPPVAKRGGLGMAATEDQTVTYEKMKAQVKAAMESSASTVPPQFSAMMGTFLDDYCSSSMAAKESPEVFYKNIGTFFKEVQKAIQSPYQFKPYHQAIREPFDYYKWGNDFLKPLIIDEQSKVTGLEQAKKIIELVNKGENVVMLSNHQTEADPQVLSILLEREGLGDLAEKTIFIAGHKVTNDPVAIPFSMGRNLICIHSKKHIRNPPEDFAKKNAQNLESMKSMGDLAAIGGRVFWVAPSGGRDRPDESGEFVVSPFDAKALDMFKLIAMQSRKPMHFFPMAMYTHQLVPPPKAVSSGLGEERSAKRGAVSVTFLPETDGLGGLKDKEFTADVQQKVNGAYAELTAWHKTFE